MNSTAFDVLGPLWLLTLGTALLAMSLLDLRARRVGNAVATMPLVIGISAHALAFGIKGAFLTAAAALMVFLPLFYLWSLGFVGAADVKMAASCAACAGLQRCGAFLIYTLLAAGVLGLFVGIDAGEKNQGIIKKLLGFVASDRLERARQRGRTVPLAVALSTGLWIAMRL